MQTPPPSDLRPAIAHQRLQLLETIETALEKPLAALGFAWLGLIVAAYAWGSNAAINVFTSVIWGIFIVDFVLRFLLATDRVAFLKQNILTAVSLILPALAFLRVLRLFSVLPSWQLVLFRLIAAMNRSMHSLATTMKRRGVAYVIALTAIVTFAGAAGMDTFERGTFANYGYSLWWTGMVMTTMGPDRYPQSTPGRLLMWALAVFGFSVFGYLTAAVASYFVNRDAGDSGSEIAGEDDINAVLSEIRALRAELKAAVSQS